MDRTDKESLLVLIILTVLLLFGIVSEIILMTGEAGFGGVLVDVSVAISEMLLIYYLFAGYKIPHGNMLKYLILFFCFSISMSIAFLPSASIVLLLKALCVLLAAFMGGRLERIYQNRLWMLLVFIMLTISGVVSYLAIEDSSFFACFGSFAFAVQWIVLCSVYFIRFREHRVAGLEIADGFLPRH